MTDPNVIVHACLAIGELSVMHKVVLCDLLYITLGERSPDDDCKWAELPAQC